MTEQQWLIALGAVILVALLMKGLGVLSNRREEPVNADGQLAPLPPTPNGVSTMTRIRLLRMDPVGFEGEPDRMLETLKAVLQSLPNCHIVSTRHDYIHAEFTTPSLKFVDDVEFLIDDREKLIHFRSASRIGLYDLGVNRRRMKQICQLLKQQTDS